MVYGPLSLFNLMKTEIIKIKGLKIPAKKLDAVVAAVKNGEPVIFPTDTVYGIGVSAFHAAGIKKIYRLKGRSSAKPLVWLIPSVDIVPTLVKDITSHGRRLMDAFWPGALTLIFRASRAAGLSAVRKGTIGLRIPRHRLAAELIRRAGVPLATTSVNRSGQASATRSSQLKTFCGKVRYIIDAGTLSGVRESTVIDVSGAHALLVREGSISKKKIEETLRV
jgi:L-threonylcarbamoyladenylate synthase